MGRLFMEDRLGFSKPSRSVFDYFLLSFIDNLGKYVKTWSAKLALRVRTWITMFITVRVSIARILCALDASL